MCLAIPMKIADINGDIAKCEAAGVRRDVNLHLLNDIPLRVGDYVLVHLGYAIQQVPSPDAQASWEAYDAMQVARDISGKKHNSPNGGSHA